MASSDEISLGKALQTARQAAGLTQQQLCQKAKLSYSTLAKIERGAIKSPSVFTIQSIAEALDVSLNELMDGFSSNTKKTAKKRSKTGIRFVYFDINGCLVRFFHAAFSKLAADTGSNADIVENIFWHYNDAACRGEMTMAEFNQKFAKRLRVETLDWQAYYMEAVEPIKAMHEFAAEVAQNYHIGLLSNIMPGFINDMLNKGLLPSLDYATIIDSSEVGAIKPEKAIYEIATARAKVPPEEILLVDDARANLMAAERMGWHVLWFDDYDPESSVVRVKSALESSD